MMTLVSKRCEGELVAKSPRVETRTSSKVGGVSAYRATCPAGHVGVFEISAEK
jgi:hypothetical protein